MLSLYVLVFCLSVRFVSFVELLHDGLLRRALREAAHVAVVLGEEDLRGEEGTVD